MTDFNIVNLKQGIGLPGASKKLQKGNTGKEHGQLMPFACIIGHACRIAKQKTEKVLFNFSPGKGKMSVPFKKGNTKGQKGLLNIDPQNNILGAGKDKTEKTNQSLPVKGNGLAESPHGVILKGEATNDSNLFMSASKGKGKTNRSFSGKINLQSQSGGQNQIGTGKDEGEGQKVKMAAAVKGKSTVEHAMTEKNTEKNSFISVNNGGKNNIGNLLKPLGLKGEAKAVVRSAKAPWRTLADEAFKESRGARVADPVGENFRNGKNIAGINNALLRGQRSETRNQRAEGKGQKAEMEERQGLLKFSLKNAAAVKGKSAVEPAMTEKNTEKNFFTPVNSGGKNDIGNSLKLFSLNGEEAIKIPHRGTPQPESASVRGFSAGGYHNNTTFHASGSSAAVNESASSYEIKPRALINQIANGAKMSGRVRIALNPPSLGTLDMDVIVRNNKVHVMLQVENNDVRQILQSNLESLKSSLRNQGLVADTINVSVQEKSDGANHGADYRSGQSETLFRESKNRKGNEEDQGGEQDFLNHDPSSLEEENQGVQSGEHGGRVSLFA